MNICHSQQRLKQQCQYNDNLQMGEEPSFETFCKNNIVSKIGHC
jgi:hypothetical protein